MASRPLTLKHFKITSHTHRQYSINDYISAFSTLSCGVPQRIRTWQTACHSLLYNSTLARWNTTIPSHIICTMMSFISAVTYCFTPTDLLILAMIHLLPLSLTLCPGSSLEQTNRSVTRSWCHFTRKYQFHSTHGIHSLLDNNMRTHWNSLLCQLYPIPQLHRWHTVQLSTAKQCCTVSASLWAPIPSPLTRKSTESLDYQIISTLLERYERSRKLLCRSSIPVTVLVLQGWTGLIQEVHLCLPENLKNNVKNLFTILSSWNCFDGSRRQWVRTY